MLYTNDPSRFPAHLTPGKHCWQRNQSPGYIVAKSCEFWGKMRICKKRASSAVDKRKTNTQRSLTYNAEQIPPIGFVSSWLKTSETDTSRCRAQMYACWHEIRVRGQNTRTACTCVHRHMHVWVVQANMCYILKIPAGFRLTWRPSSAAGSRMSPASIYEQNHASFEKYFEICK